MTYQWNPRELTTVFALPAGVADQSLKMAGLPQLKVLIWFARRGTFDPAACAAATGYSAADCADAMQYWVERGILRAEGEPASPVSPLSQAPLPPLQPAAQAGGKPPRPQLPQVLERQRTDRDFAYLIKTAEARLGRPVTPGEMETFAYINEGLGLPAEVILMMLVDALKRGRLKVPSAFRSYLEKMAVSWSDQGIVTVAAAEAELCRRERQEELREKLQTLFSLNRTPTLLQTDAALRWFDEWRFSEEVVKVAYERCREKTGGFNAAYVTRILESWHADGISTPEAARQALVPAKRGGAKPLLSEQADSPGGDAYEQAVADWRPTYKKKGKKT